VKEGVPLVTTHSNDDDDDSIGDLEEGNDEIEGGGGEVWRMMREECEMKKSELIKSSTLDQLISNQSQDQDTDEWDLNIPISRKEDLELALSALGHLDLLPSFSSSQSPSSFLFSFLISSSNQHHLNQIPPLIKTIRGCFKFSLNL